MSDDHHSDEPFHADDPFSMMGIAMVGMALQEMAEQEAEPREHESRPPYTPLPRRDLASGAWLIVGIIVMVAIMLLCGLLASESV